MTYCVYCTDCCCLCRFSPIPEEDSGHLDSEDGGAGIKAAQPTDWHSDGNSSEDGEAANGPAKENGPTALAASSSRGRLSAL